MTDVLPVDIDGIEKSLMAEEKLAIMDEHIFVEYFLPYFKDNTIDNGEQIINKWVEYADGATKEVMVVNKEGVEIYRVPPVVSSIDIEKTIGTSYNKLEDHVEREKERLPIKGAREHKILLNEAVSSIEPISYKERWLSIYERYREDKPDTVLNEMFDILDDDEISF